MTLHTYIVTVKHDNGTTRIATKATSIQAAVSIICNVENCPERAIINIKIKHDN